MQYRYLSSWANNTEFGRALTRSTGWLHAVPRVGSFFPGITTPMPDPKNYSFQEICFARAEELWKEKSSITVMWSGGVDSTLVALVLAVTKPIGCDLFVTANAQSLSDGKDALRSIEILGGTIKPFVKGEGYPVTGYHADSMLIGEFYDHKSIGEDIWTIGLTEAFQRYTGWNKSLCEEAIETLKPLIDLMPLEKTAANVCWWIDFSTFWDRDEYDAGYRLGLGIPGRDYTSFFSSELFQSWAIKDAREKAKHGYKGEYIQLIDRFTGCSLQFKKNTLLESLVVDHRIMSDKLLAIKEDYSIVMRP